MGKEVPLFFFEVLMTQISASDFEDVELLEIEFLALAQCCWPNIFQTTQGIREPDVQQILSNSIEQTIGRQQRLD